MAASCKPTPPQVAVAPARRVEHKRSTRLPHAEIKIRLETPQKAQVTWVRLPSPARVPETGIPSVRFSQARRTALGRQRTDTTAVQCPDSSSLARPEMEKGSHESGAPFSFHGHGAAGEGLRTPDVVQRPATALLRGSALPFRSSGRFRPRLCENDLVIRANIIVPHREVDDEAVHRR